MIYTDKFIKECSLYENEEVISEGFLSDAFSKVEIPEELRNDVNRYFKEIKKICADFKANTYKLTFDKSKQTIPFKDDKHFDDIMDKAEKGLDKKGKEIGYRISLSRVAPPNFANPGSIATDLNNIYISDGYRLMPKSKNIFKSAFQERALYKETEEYFYIVDTNLTWTTYNGVFSSYDCYYAKFYAIPNNEKSRKRLNLIESAHSSIFEFVNI